jgi:hypothetical protein
MFFLGSDRAGLHAVTVTLTARCDTSGAHEIPSDEPGTQRFEEPLLVDPVYTGLRYYRFPGGCVTYRFSLGSDSVSALLFDADAAISFTPRSTLVAYVETTEDLALCGRGAVCGP